MSCLQERADVGEENTAFVFLNDRGGEEDRLSYGELDRRARVVAGYLQRRARPNDRAVLLYPPGKEYVTAFTGCLYAGVVATPLYPPRANQHAARVDNVIADCGGSWALTSRELQPRVSRFLGLMDKTQRPQILATDALTEAEAADWREPDLKPDSLAFLQYTSGSTGKPKGVMVSHGNLMANEAAIGDAFATTTSDICLNWLPLYHDMGLIGTVLQAIYRGFVSILIPPVAFIRDPLLWLKAISRYRATLCGGPNFGYDLCVRRAQPAQLAGLDLSSWRVAFNGAEPVRAETLEGFAQVFSPHGFRKKVFLACYGMAEATLLISGAELEREPTTLSVDADELAHNRATAPASAESRSLALVGCGRVEPRHRVRVVDPVAGRACSENEVGEIWFSGPSVALGYWGKDELTRSIFQARLADGEGPFLRTGDLGFLRDGELFITGRLKDLIIIRGRNYYPQDIEAIVDSSHPALRAGACVAFGIAEEGQERLAIVAEVKRTAARDLDAGAAIAAIRAQAAVHFELQVQSVALVKQGGVLRTTSGKIRRRATREAFLTGALPMIESHVLDADPAAAVRLARVELLGVPREQRTRALTTELCRLIAALAGIDVAEARPDRSAVALGLDSITAMELQRRLEADLGMTPDMTAFLDNRPIASMAAELAAGLEIEAPKPQNDRAVVEELDGTHPLSPNQAGLWYLHQLDPESAAYNLSFAVDIHAPLDAERLHQAVDSLAARHTALRTRFKSGPDGPTQAIDPNSGPDFHRMDAVDWTENQVDAFLAATASRPFDLARGPLWRIYLMRSSSARHILLVSVHHIVADFWSLTVLMDELWTYYAAYCAGREPALAEPGPAFATVARQRARALSATQDALLDWWRTQLAGLPPHLELPVDRPRPRIQTFNGQSHAFHLDADQTRALSQLAREANTTLFTLLMAAFQTLLHRHSGQDDFAVGSPTSGRDQGSLENVVGYLVNPVALRARFHENMTFRELLEATRTTALAALRRQALPFQTLVEKLLARRAPSHAPLFQTMFILQKPHRLPEAAAFALSEPGAALQLGGLSLTSRSLAQRAARFDLTLTMAERDGGLGASLEYNTDLFEATTIARWAGHFQTLLKAASANPDRAVADLELLSERERGWLVAAFNRTRADCPNQSVYQKLLARAAQTPDALALTVETADCRKTALTYAGLATRAAALSRRLRARGIGPESRVGVCLDRDASLPTVLLAIFGAGGAFAPLDPANPRDRLSLILEDAQPRLILVHSALRSRLPPGEVELLLVDEMGDAPDDGPVAEGEADRAWLGPDQLAYLIYTSGSTGKPKGVQVSHGNLANFLETMARRPGLDERDVLLAVTPLSFDIAGLELFLPLWQGARLALADRGTTGDGAALARVLKRSGATVLQATPATWRLLLAAGWRPNPGLAMLCGGEALPPDLAAALGCGRLWNMYGPTETTIWSAVHPVATDQPSAGGVVPIGRPIANTALYALDRRLQLAPAGIPGKLYIGGQGLARGYWGRPDLTAERFVPDPFDSSRPGGHRLYDTGDLVRILPGGEFACLGRLDFQIKLRGFRIELGEVEAALNAHSGLSDAVAGLLQTDAGDHRLTAWLVARGEPPDLAGLRGFLAEKLPAYMIPSHFLFREAFPLTSSGKIDRRALARDHVEDETEAVHPPETPAQARLAEIWARLLDRERVDVHADFFELGGHSLLAVQMARQAEEAFGAQMPFGAFLAKPTIAAMAERLAQAEPLEMAVSTPRNDNLALSSAQERLYFLGRMDGAAAAYNMPRAFLLSGSLDTLALQEAFRLILVRHEVLRTAFFETDSGLTQRPFDVVDFPFAVLDLGGLPVEESRAHALALVEREAAKPFDLQGDPLLRAQLLRLGEGRFVLAITLHHIAADGASTEMLARELAAYYTISSQGRQPTPAPLPLQFADAAAWLRRRQQSEKVERDVTFWRQRLEGAPELHPLPMDRPRPPLQTYRSGAQDFFVNPTLARALRELGRSTGATPFATLQALFAVLLARHGQDRDLVCGTPVSGRNHARFADLIGPFVNTVVLRHDLSGDPSFRAFLLQARQTVFEALAHQDAPFESVVEALSPQRAPDRSPLFQIMFAMQQAAVHPMVLPGLRTDVFARPRPGARFDLTFFVEETANGWACAFEYNADLFEQRAMARLADRFLCLARAATARPDQSAFRLSLLSAAERRELLEVWSRGPSLSRSRLCLHQWVERQAAATPDAVALIHRETRISYRRLDVLATGLARRLAAIGVGPETSVGILTPRAPGMLAAILATLKAGGAYVPLDPEYPEERLRQILADSGATVLVAGFGHALPEQAGVLPLLVDEEGVASGPPPGNVSLRPASPQNLSHIIYTSGSTGRPKGVAIRHESATTLLAWAHTVFSREDLALTLAGTSIGFDISLFEIFAPLSFGGSLALAENVLEWPQLPHWERITLVNTVPSAMAELVSRVSGDCALRVVNLAGEPLPPALASAIHRRWPEARLFNLYGPSEDATFSTWVPIDEKRTAAPPIGFPLANTTAYLLDTAMEPVPPGAAGELFLGGAGLARGYYGRPDLTAQAFVPNPFAHGNAATSGIPAGGFAPAADALRLYRTGDLARYLFSEDGGAPALAFLGRRDHQVKLRGFRIELGEIEARLSAHPGVRAAVATVRELPRGPMLAAYVQPLDETVDATAGLIPEPRAFLRGQLPAYMVPDVVMTLPALPLTASGKVDRKRLPLPRLQEPPTQCAALAAPMERIIADIWAEVLGLDDPVELSANADFFDLGGHSLLALRVLGRIHQAFGVSLPPRALFEAPTISRLASRLAEAKGERPPQPIVAVNSKPGEPIPLSPAQERLWFLESLDEQADLGGAYHMAAAFRLAGPLAVASLEGSFTVLVDRHEPLRTVFPAPDGAPRQQIVPSGRVVLDLVDLSGLERDEAEAAARTLASRFAARPFSLASETPFRSTLFRLAAGRHALATVLHHIAGDGWSVGVLTREIGALYRASIRGEAPTLPALPISYARYAVWERARQAGAVAAEQLRYWTELLADAPTLLPLPLDRPRPPLQTYRGGLARSELAHAPNQALRDLARRHHATLFMCLHAAYVVLLARHSGRREAVVGVPIAGRDRPELEPLIGLFVNTLALRSELTEQGRELSFREVLQRTRRAALDAYAHRDTPFDRIVGALEPERNLSHSPIFQAAFSMQNAEPPAPDLGPVRVRSFPLDLATARFDLTLFAVEADGALQFSWEYNADLFDHATIARMAGRFNHLLTAVATCEERAYGDLPMLGRDERRQLIMAFNQGEAARPSACFIHHVIRRQAQERSARIAVVEDRDGAAPRMLSYAALMAKAVRVSHALRVHGVGPEQPVAVFLERGLDMVAALLGALEAGAAYMPMDPAAPPERLAFMMDQAGVPAVIADSRLRGALPDSAAAVVCMDRLAPSQSPPARPALLPSHPAYVIYTSGSTGKPKGVVNSHQGIFNRIAWAQETLPIKPRDRVLHKTPFIFDVSVWEIFWPLMYGARLAMARPQGHMDPFYLSRVIVQERITITHFVPSMLRCFLDQAAPDPGANLRRVFSSGEALTSELRDRFHEVLNAELHNMYGPTEASVEATWRPCMERGGIVPIGKAIANVQVHVLDFAMRPVPEGVAGGLFIGGLGLARGYLRRPELTAQAFLPNPFAGGPDSPPTAKPGDRLYFTGDLARFLPGTGGEVEFLGRMDSQIKLRGFRIELGEIETALLACPEIGEAAATLVHEGADAYLAAYVTTAPELSSTWDDAGDAPAPDDAPGFRTLTDSALAAIAKRLPSYMVPERMIWMRAMPVTVSGKLDRKALPQPRRLTMGAAAGPQPQTPTQSTLARIWTEVLGVESPAIDQNFFRLGGHSLLAMRAVTRLREVCRVSLPVRALFEAPTIAALAARVDAARESDPVASTAIEPTRRDEVAPVSPAQSRLWFLHRLNPESASYNMAMTLEMNGILDLQTLARCLDVICARHEPLRTVFLERNGEPLQAIADTHAIPLLALDLSGAGMEGVAHRLARRHAKTPFVLEKGPLARVAVFRLGPTRHWLLTCMHHLISDGWSMHLLVRELRDAYRARLAGSPPDEGAPALQYVDFSLWQRRRLTGEALARRIAWWRAHLADPPPPATLSPDRPRAPFRAGRHTLNLDPSLAAKLETLARRRDASLFMVLLAAFQLLLSRHAGADDVTVGCPIAGRNHPDLMQMIGFFVNTLAIRHDLSDNPTFSALLDRVRQTCLSAYEHQDLPFDMLVEALSPDRAGGDKNPYFNALFNMLNLPETALRLPGLQIVHVDEEPHDPKFELTLYAKKRPDGGLRLTLSYHAGLFRAGRMAHFLDQYQNLLGQAVAAPQTPIAAFDLAAGAMAASLPDPSAPLASYWEGPVHRWHAHHAHRRPRHPALVDERYTLDYAQLAALVRTLARELSAGGVQRGEMVAIRGHREGALAVAILATLSVSAAFVIVDASYPAMRLQACLEAAKPAVWLDLPDAPPLDEARADALASYSFRRRFMLADPATAVAAEPADELDELATAPGDLAYVTFTSGTAGRPRAIAGNHGPLSNFLAWYPERLGLGADDRFSMISGLAHDPLLRDIFTPLRLGATLCVPRQARFDTPRALCEWLASQRISVVHLTPALGRMLADAAGGEPIIGASLRRLVFGGDALSQEDATRARRLAADALVFNCYGTTETPQIASCFEVSKELDAADDGASLPVGSGTPGARLLLLNSGDRLAGVGEIAEICVQSPHLARGYVDDLDETERRFTRNPLSGDPADRLYRTGDLGRYREDGAVLFHGRADDQVIIRGYRFEPREACAALLDHPKVKDAFVTAFRDGENLHLAAYVAAVDGESADENALQDDFRAHLELFLPRAVIPACFVLVPRLPLTVNGKVDRGALPDPRDRLGSGNAYTPPRNEMEALVCGIWSDLLARDRVGVHDDFFQLGGHSLMAARSIARLRERLGVEASLADFFKARTVARLAGALTAARRPQIELEPAPPGEKPQLSFAQQRLWVLEQLERPGPAYNICVTLRLRGALDATAMEIALATLTARHETLRSAFAQEEGEPYAIISKTLTPVMTVEDLSALGSAAQTAATRLAERQADRAFELTQLPLWRLRLWRLGREDHVMTLCLHHAIADGWSAGILVRELEAAYSAAAMGRSAALPALPAQYRDYARWQRRLQASGAWDRQLTWWRERLAGLPARLNLPTDRPRPAQQTYRGGNVAFRLDPPLTTSLRALSQERNATLFVTLLTVFQIQLARYAGQDDLAVGCPVANRERSCLEGLVGMFVNTLALRARVQSKACFVDLLDRAQVDVLNAQSNQDAPFELVVETAQPDRGLNHSPLFQAMFIFQNAPREDFRLPSLSANRVQTPRHVAKFDLTLSLSEEDGGVVGDLEYNADLFEPGTAQRFADHYSALLAGAAADPHVAIARLPLLTEAERERLLREERKTDREYPRELRLDQWFERQAAATPDAVALVSAEGNGPRWSYAVLNRCANRVARRLLACGCGPESLVGLCMSRSPQMLVALLGALKAGAAYVPLDPEYPINRLAYMVEDAGLDQILGEGEIAGELAAGGVTLIDLGDARLMLEDDANLATAARSQNAAYVIYTSGSTGRPKGVAICHRTLVNLMGAILRRPGLHRDDRMLAVTSISFDIAVLELFLPLLAGACVVLANRRQAADPERLSAAMERYRVTVMQATPTTWRMLVDAGWRNPRRVHAWSGGEALPDALAEALTIRGALFNMYGPTETTVWSAVARVGATPVDLGTGLDNTRLYTLDPHGNLQPEGVSGELWIGGKGLARGYWKRPGLTAERFVPDPFAGPGARMYRTGDLARRACCGGKPGLYYLGRLDHQLKIRGFRVELGEIESVLAQCPKVASAVAAARQDDAGQWELAAYVIPVEGAMLEAAELQSAARERLPHYMTPTTIAVLDRYPLTSNGKIDRAALSRIATPRGAAVAERTGRTVDEELLAGVWFELLGIERISGAANFFELGGQSLKALRLVARIRAVFGVELPLKEVFDSPTLKAMSARVSLARKRDRGLAPPPIKPIAEGFSKSLSFAQQRVWLATRSEGDNSAYHLSFSLELGGQLSTAALGDAVKAILRRHDSLRAVFALEGDGPVQRVRPEDGGSPPVIDLCGLVEPETAAEWLRRQHARRPFDLETGPLIRTALLRLGPMRHILLATLHHIVADGWSLGVLVGELTSFYRLLLEGREPPPRQGLQYADYAAWQRGWLKGPALRERLAWWRRTLLSAPREQALPLGLPRGGHVSYVAGRRAVRLEPDLVAALAELARRERATLFMALLAGFQILRHCHTGEERLVVGTDAANRDMLELEPMIGFFVNQLTLYTDLAGNPRADEILQRVRENTLAAYARQDTPFDKVVEMINPPRVPYLSPLFQIKFALHNVPLSQIELPGLTARLLPGDQETAKLDLQVNLHEQDGGLVGNVVYKADLFSSGAIVRLWRDYQCVLARLAEGLDLDLACFKALLEQRRPARRGSPAAKANPFEKRAKPFNAMKKRKLQGETT